MRPGVIPLIVVHFFVSGSSSSMLPAFASKRTSAPCAPPPITLPSHHDKQPVMMFVHDTPFGGLTNNTHFAEAASYLYMPLATAPGFVMSAQPGAKRNSSP